ncbi:MAG: YceI family protein [Pseudobdellovibrio sp.]|jgi:polyisoprenoid-binding protein YceI|nr:YceI family protein [Pseudobdellovibrio sp.]
MKTLILSTLLLAGSLTMADVYQIDPAASRVEWKAGKKIGSYHNGDIKVKSGQVETDKKGAVKSANVVVDMKTIGNEDLKADADSQKKLVGHLSSDDFFKVEKYPESTFVLKTLKPKAGAKDEYIAKGDLTMIGKTEAVEFPVKITKDNNLLKGEGTLSIERLKWGLQYGSGSIFKSLTADKIINDSFDLKLNLVANKK